MREMEETDLNCKTCGACCTSSDNDAYIPVTALDRRRLPTKYQKKLQACVALEPGDVVEPYALGLKTFGNLKACVALKGRLGKDISCEVYAQRPDYCRAFDKGSADCLERRREVFFIKPNYEEE